MLLRPLVLACLLAIAPATPAQQVFVTPLTGAAEIPPNASPGTGNVFVSFSDPILSFNVSFGGLTGTTTMAHIHCCSATTNVGVATQVPNFATFPTGVTTGTHVQQLDLDQASSWNSAFITSSGGTTQLAKTRLLERMALGEAYYNVHTSTFGGGEIRGILVLDTILADGFE
jgi:hypothetical protein